MSEAIEPTSPVETPAPTAEPTPNSAPPTAATAETTILFEKDISLAKLNELVVAEEKRLGPLKALGRTNKNNAATYKLGRRPKQPVILKQKIGSAANVPEGHSKVSEGDVWIANQPQSLVAFRKKPA